MSGAATSERPMIRTFFDSGVLIAAIRSVGPDRERALQVLEEPNRVFLTSPFVHLEVVPKSIFYKKRLERSFYDRYLANAEWYPEAGKIEAAAHTAAAKVSRADEFITTEKPNKAIHRSSLVKVVHLFS